MRAIRPSEFRGSKVLGSWLRFLVDILGSRMVNELYSYDSSDIECSEDLAFDCEFEDRVRLMFDSGRSLPIDVLAGVDSSDHLVRVFSDWENEVYSDLCNIESKDDYEKYLARLAKRARAEVPDAEKSIKLERDIAKDFAMSRGYIQTGNTVDNRSALFIQGQEKAQDLIDKWGLSAKTEVNADV